MHDMMIGTSSRWNIRDDNGSMLDPAQVEEIAQQVMEALLDVESESGGRVHSASVDATLVEGRISIEFCVNAPSIDAASIVATRTLQDILQQRLGHNLRHDSVQETSLSYELVPA
jgi:hypothetical protein